MVFAIYAVLLLACWRFASDLVKPTQAPPTAAHRRQMLGVALAAGPGLAPAIASWNGWLGGDAGTLGLLASVYLISFLAFAAGMLGFGPPAVGRFLRRAGYGALLAVSLLPSWGLILLGPLVAGASIGLVEANPSGSF